MRAVGLLGPRQVPNQPRYHPVAAELVPNRRRGQPEKEKQGAAFIQQGGEKEKHKREEKGEKTQREASGNIPQRQREPGGKD